MDELLRALAGTPAPESLAGFFAEVDRATAQPLEISAATLAAWPPPAGNVAAGLAVDDLAAALDGSPAAPAPGGELDELLRTLAGPPAPDNLVGFLEEVDQAAATGPQISAAALDALTASPLPPETVKAAADQAMKDLAAATAAGRDPALALISEWQAAAEKESSSAALAQQLENTPPPQLPAVDELIEQANWVHPMPGQNDPWRR